MSRYVGSDYSEDKVLPELKELLEDEEGEVATEAFAQYQKHLATVFSYDFVTSIEAVDIFCEFCDLTDKSDLCGMDFGIILQKLGKIIVTLDRPDDERVLQKIKHVIEQSIRPSQEEETRAMVPRTFEGICYVYRHHPAVLLDLYEKHFSSFIQNEIRMGQEGKKKEKVESARGTSKGILYDLLENEKQSKMQREDTNDCNYLVNRSIVQNMHFFFGAFL